MTAVYQYIGSSDLKNLGWDTTQRICLDESSDALVWMGNPHPAQVVTFVVDVNGLLWIADRQSEHVACARGGDVLSAGEMTFEFDHGKVLVTDVSNQSTGYCPEPESWPAVAAALDKAGVPHPGRFTQAFLFRRCVRKAVDRQTS